ncbi:MAG TPA: glycosyltransferase [Acidimicrobiales bacterium]|nr:glycosyltransferase [Acidimicrobiales bacterium]
MSPTVTVLVPTHRRPASLARALAGLAGQQDPGFDWRVLVVVNDAAAGPTFAIVDRAGLGVPCRVVIEPRLGAGHARNRGIAEADGRVVAMIDDDVVPEPAWLGSLVAPILGGRADGVGGAVRLDPSVPRPRWFDEDGIGGYLTSFRPADQERPVAESEYVVTANAAFDVALLRRCGGFDPAMGPRGRSPMVGDDVVLTRRVAAAGGRLIYAPAAVVVHELPSHRLRPGYLLRRAWAQGRSDWRANRPDLARRRLNGSRVAVSWLGHELVTRLQEGPQRPEVTFHGLCDLARTAGALREAASWGRGPT